MKKTVLCLSMIAMFVGVSNAQVLPAKVKSFLDAYYTTRDGGPWTKVPGFCGNRKSILTGDFDGNKQIDYLVRFKTGKSANTTRLHLIAFINRNGEYEPVPFFDEAYRDDFLRSSVSIIKKGTTVSLGQGEEGSGPTTKLTADAVTQYICETDASRTYIYKNGTFQNISQ